MKGVIVEGIEASILMVELEENAARQLAQEEFDRFYAKYGSYVEKSIHVPLRELYADRGMVGYLIRIRLNKPMRYDP